MAIAAIVEFPAQAGQSEQEMKEGYDRVTREFNNGQPMDKTSDWGAGLIAHTAGFTAGGEWWIVDVWRDQQSMDQFMQKMMPIVQRQENYAEPSVRIVNVHKVVTQ